MYKSISILLSIVFLTSCMKWESPEIEPSISVDGEGIYILNEGNFQYGNATLSYYNPVDKTVENEVFYRSNGMKLGDVAQSMNIFDDKGWIVVNNSHVIFAIDLKTFREKGRIEGLTSPRYIHFVNENKAYVSQLWDNRITIVNPKKFTITGYIEVPEMKQSTASTEQMVQIGDYVYCVCWSHQRNIIKIDVNKDCVVAKLDVGAQPQSITLDAEGFLWVLTDGGYKGSPSGYEEPHLIKINPVTFSIEKTFVFPITDSPTELCVADNGNTLFWLNKDVWKMDIHSEVLPSKPFVYNIGTIFYGLSIDNKRNEIYVADAIDYQQQGMVYRYSSQGEILDSFYVGVIPGFFMIQY